MSAKPRTRQAPRGFTLVELLVSVLLLTIATASLMVMWSLSRRVVENARDAGEYYAVARQEVERDKADGFEKIFLDASNNAAPRTTFRTDYDETGRPLTTTNLAVNAAATAGAYYRAVSAYYLVKTGSETKAVHQLGIQRVRVYRRQSLNAAFSESTAMKAHETTVFYSTSEQWRHDFP